MIEHLIATYGYPILLVGTFFEGETILIIAGMAAFEGLLDLHTAILTAFIGTMLGDSVYFFVGRYKGEWLLGRIPSWRLRVDRVLRALERHTFWLILTFRFMYVVRNVTSIAVGMSRTPAWLFLTLNAIGAGIWAMCFGYGGYFFGEALIAAVDDLKGHQMQVLGAFCVLSLLLWLYRIRKARRQAAPLPLSNATVVPNEET